MYGSSLIINHWDILHVIQAITKSELCKRGIRFILDFIFAVWYRNLFYIYSMITLLNVIEIYISPCI